MVSLFDDANDNGAQDGAQLGIRVRDALAKVDQTGIERLPPR